MDGTPMDAADAALFERGLGRATATSSGDALDRALVDLGWAEGLAADPRTAIAVLFELQGREHASSAALGQVLAGGVGHAAATTVVLPPLGGWDPPGHVVDRRWRVRGTATGALPPGGHTLVVATLDGQPVALTVETEELVTSRLGGWDPDLGLVAVAGDGDAGHLLPVHAVDWPRAVALARLALSHQLVGGARRMLELARQHALERVQFGRPIGSFQAVGHRLADSLVAIEGAASLLDAAWDDPSPSTAAVAKAFAGRAARLTATHCQQVLAGIGFTTEHPLHRYVRRTLVLDQLLGSAGTLSRRLGDEVLRHRALPEPIPL